MGNNMSKMINCQQQFEMRQDLKSQMKAIAAQQKELNARLEFCDKCIDEIKDFKRETKMSDTVSKALWRGLDELLEERYMLNSEYFDLSQKIAEILVSMIEIDMQVKSCSEEKKM